MLLQDYEGEQCRKALMRDGHPAAMALGAVPMHGMPPPMPGPMGPLPPIPPPLPIGMRPGGLGLPPKGPPLGDMPMANLPLGNTVFVANVSNFTCNFILHD